MMSKRENLLRSLSSARFALWELHLYLDTHPLDMSAAAKHAEYKKKAEALQMEYEQEFGPLSPSMGEGVEWLKNPWPWEREGNEE